jgi:hypothetical protein
MNAEPLLAMPSALPETGMDPYRFPGTRDCDGDWLHSAVTAGEDELLPPPDPSRRVPLALAAPDRRRLDLHVALTRTGVAPLPGDLDAIKVLSALDDTTIATILRWITSPSPKAA